jgi:ADP-ribosyl-[dinitrogen reductase] hydrolase
VKTIKNSQSSPLIIAEVLLPNTSGRLGLTLCPGKKDSMYEWDRDLDTDIGAIQVWGADTVITLIEDHEFALLCVTHLGEAVRRQGMDWLHLPIRDVDVPDQRFESAWQSLGCEVHEKLDAGKRILIHCRGGLGRTGLVAGLILVERGYEPTTAIQTIRAARPHAIETRAQERYVLNVKRLHSAATPIVANQRMDGLLQEEFRGQTAFVALSPSLVKH